MKLRLWQIKKHFLSYILYLFLFGGINVSAAVSETVEQKQQKNESIEQHCKKAMKNMKHYMPNILDKAKKRAAKQGVDLTKDKQVQQLTLAITNSNELHNMTLDCQARWEKYQASAVCMAGADSESAFALCIPKLPE
ncbi:hypothetical protein [Zooshikella harenae]|uniref:DUF1311 domain-containing protein n=1 Tax=Zooshikella harenae TaxID=2827238 RepID=A0ABS5ZAL7_9GAMM|nr:hypothetical protein [Zooshikella harenae]MBU2711097.1 hypothetical protein [Zooshikella harenae]